MALTRIAHYELLDKLGEGGMGEVHRALDTHLDRHVAIKMLSRTAAAADGARRRFMQEAKAASALNHPNIVTIHEIDEWEGADYIVMEFIEGQTLRALANERPQIPRLLPVFRQLSEALAAAHASGIVHRDIKPDNLMLRADGYVKVLDFGIARLSRQAEPEDATMTSGGTIPGMLIGTARYMSPEQARGELAEGPSDIFSLGIVFYEVSTGRHPFYSSTPGMTMSGILADEPQEPRRVNPEIPAALEDLILRMLAKERLLRPRAEGVASSLAAMTQSAPAPAVAAGVNAQRSSVGREGELRTLLQLFETSRRGASLMACVTGEPGMGKTTLAEEFISEIRSRHGTAWVGRGRCSERLGGADAFLPVLEGLESLLRGDSGDQAARLMRRFAPTWYLQVAPSIGDSTVEVLFKEAKSASQERMKLEIHAYLQELSRARPIVLLLDDVHWADVSTCDLLSYLGAKCQELPVLLVATYRPSTLLAAKHVFLQVQRQFQSRGSCTEVALPLLNRGEVDRYIALRYPQNCFPAALNEVICQKTEGSPLFLADMLRYLADRQILAERDGVWTLLQEPREVAREVPATVRSMIEVKIEALSEDDRRLLVAASVQGVEFDSAVLAKVLGAEPMDIEDRLQHLDSVHGLVKMAGEEEYPDRTLTVRYRFVHGFYQNALHAMLTASRRTATSLSVARAILAFGGGRERSRASGLALLLEAGRDFAQAAVYFLAASRNAARVFAYPEAASMAERGLKTLGALPESIDRDKLELPLSMTLGISLMATKGYAAPEVVRTHIRSRELSHKLGDTRRLFPVLWALCSAYMIAGRLPQSIEVAHEMVDSAEAGDDPAMLVEALNSLGSTLSYMGRLEESRRHFERILGIYDPARQSFSMTIYLLDPLVTTLSVLSRTQALSGLLDEALDSVRQAITRAERLTHPQSVAYALFFLAWVHHVREEVEPARSAMEQSMQMSREHALPQIGEWCRIIGGWVACRNGAWEKGAELILKSLDRQQAMHSALERPYCLALLALAQAHMGRSDDAIALIDQALTLGLENDDRSYEPELHRLRGEILELQPGCGPRAREAYRTALELARQEGARALELKAALSLYRSEPGGAGASEASEALAATLRFFGDSQHAPLVESARQILTNDAGPDQALAASQS